MLEEEMLRPQQGAPKNQHIKHMKKSNSRQGKLGEIFQKAEQKDKELENRRKEN